MSLTQKLGKLAVFVQALVMIERTKSNSSFYFHISYSRTLLWCYKFLIRGEVVAQNIFCLLLDYHTLPQTFNTIRSRLRTSMEASILFETAKIYCRSCYNAKNYLFKNFPASYDLSPQQKYTLNSKKAQVNLSSLFAIGAREEMGVQREGFFLD